MMDRNSLYVAIMATDAGIRRLERDLDDTRQEGNIDAFKQVGEEIYCSKMRLFYLVGALEAGIESGNIAKPNWR